MTGEGLGNMRECWKWEEFPHLSSPRTGKCGESYKDYIDGRGEGFPCFRLWGLKQPVEQGSCLAAHG